MALTLLWNSFVTLVLESCIGDGPNTPMKLVYDRHDGHTHVGDVEMR